MGFVQGFATGYGLVDGTMRQNRAEERQANMDAENQRRYDQNFGLRQKEFDANQEQRQQSQDNWQKEFAIRESQAKNSEELNKIRIDQQKLVTRDARNKEAMKYIQVASTGADIGDEGRKAIGNSAYAGIWNSMENKVGEVQQHFAQYQNLKTPEELSKWLNSPKTREYAKDIFSNEIYAREKATGMDYEISSLVPMNGGVLPHFNVYKDGVLVKRNVPATERKTGENGDTLKIIPLGELKQKALGTVNFVSMVKNNPEMQKVLGLSAGKRDLVKLGKNDVLVDRTTGKQVASNTSPDEITQAKLDEMYAKYVNSVANGGLEQPMSKQAWLKLNGFGDNQESGGGGNVDVDKLKSLGLIPQ